MENLYLLQFSHPLFPSGIPLRSSAAHRLRADLRHQQRLRQRHQSRLDPQRYLRALPAEAIENSISPATAGRWDAAPRARHPDRASRRVCRSTARSHHRPRRPDRTPTSAMPTLGRAAAALTTPTTSGARPLCLSSNDRRGCGTCSSLIRGSQRRGSLSIATTSSATRALCVVRVSACGEVFSQRAQRFIEQPLVETSIYTAKACGLLSSSAAASGPICRRRAARISVSRALHAHSRAAITRRLSAEPSASGVGLSASTLSCSPSLSRTPSDAYCRRAHRNAQLRIYIRRSERSPAAQHSASSLSSPCQRSN